jgi:hypothetical protein
MRNTVVLYRALCLACGLVLLLSWGCDFPTTAGVNSSKQDFQTTQVRYVNLTNSQVGHVLQAQFTVYSSSTRTSSVATITTATVEKLQMSQFFVPLADSSRITVLETSASMASYSLAQPLTFTARNATYTIIGLPPIPEKGKVSILDTLLVVTSLPPDASANTANVRFINCIGDTTKMYSFALGCPSGTPVGSQLLYRASSGVMPIALNGESLSIAVTVQTRPISSTASASAAVQIGQFNLRPLSVGNSYTILLYKDAQGTPSLLALNDRSSSPVSVSSNSLPVTYLRVANFSSTALESVVYGTIATSVGLATLTDYQTFTACASASQDTIIVNRRNGIPSQTLATSLDVNGSQTMFVGDSLVAIASALTTQVPATSVAVRVVNLSSQNVSVFRGATTLMPTQSIANNVLKGGVSAAFFMPRENLQSSYPFMVFSVGLPQTLLQTGIATVPAMGIKSASYFLVIQDNQMTLVADEAKSLSPKKIDLSNILPKGALVQALHAFADETTASVSIELDQTLQDNINFGISRLTVLPAGSARFIMGGATLTKPLESGLHYVVIGIGAGTSRQILLQRGLWTPENINLTPSSVQSTLRYLNASGDVNSLLIQTDGTQGFSFNTPIALGSFSPIDRFYTSQSPTFNFKSDAATILFTARNLTFSLGKAYTIIFAGQSSTAYSAIVLPEY